MSRQTVVLKDLKIGDKYGRWTILSKDVKKYHWNCLCTCGAKVAVSGYQLVSKNSKSCGCFKTEPRPDKRKNLTGQTLGLLTIIKPIGITEKKQLLWECRCACGKMTALTTNKLSYRKQKSCGCEQATRLPNGQAAFNRMYDRYKRHARAANRVFELDKNQFFSLTQKACIYCNAAPTREHKSSTARSNGKFYGNGIDRVDNKDGYTVKNSVSCCIICNRAKHAAPVEEFKEWVDRVYQHLHAETSVGFVVFN